MKIKIRERIFPLSQTYLGGHFEIEKKQARIDAIGELEAIEGFWLDTDNATKIQKEKSILQETLNNFLSVQELFDDWVTLMEFAEEGDEESAKESLSIWEKGIVQYAATEKQLLLAG